jgi:molybdenum cofactor cytidylyltransferase
MSGVVAGDGGPLPDAHAIVLAAGAGRRFGGRKMLAPWRGAPLVVAAARVALAAPVAGVTVVTGADHAEVAAALRVIGDPRLATAFNPRWPSGIASSLKTGLGALPSVAERIVVFLGDMPEPPADMAARLLRTLEQGAPAALVEVAGRPGHPVAFRRSLVAALQGISGDRGARALLAAVPGAVIVPSEDPGCLFDIDRPIGAPSGRNSR